MKKIFEFYLVLFLSITGTVFTMNAETRKILVVGNSFSFDAALQEFLPIVQAAGDDIVLGFPYKGGTTLELHMNYITTNQQIYNYYKIKSGKMTSTGGNSRKFDVDIITDEDWDTVIIQTDHNYSGSYSHYFPYLDNLITYLRTNLTNKDAKFYLYMTWAYQDGSAKLEELINKGLYTDQMDQYTKIVDCASRAAIQSGIGEENIIPGGTAVQNGRTSYIGDDYNRDGYHMNLGHGRYTVALTWYEKIFGKSVIGLNYHPASVSDFCAEMCQHAAHEAIITPKSISNLADIYGVNPDAKPKVVDRPLMINFGIGVGSSAVSQYSWNSLTNTSAGANVRNLYNSKGYGTEVKVSIEKPFDGISSVGTTSSTTTLDMPLNVSKSTFYGTTESSVIISGLYPGQAYDMSVFASVMNISANSETIYSFRGENDGSVSINPTGNTANIATVPGIIANDKGRIYLTVKAGANNSGDKKTYYLGALMMTPHLEIPGKIPVYINFTTNEKTAKEDSWNNVTSHLAGTKIENLTDSENNASGISLNITKGFAGTTENGASETNTLLNMPINASSTGYWVNGVEKDGVFVDNAEIIFTGLDPKKSYDFYMFGSYMNATEVHEAEYSTFGIVENYIGLNGNNNDKSVAELSSIYPDAEGNIRFTVTPGATSADTYKIGFINAMAIMVPSIVKVVPFEPVTEGPWDGVSMIEPTRDASGNCVIYTGAELAWVANQVNQDHAIAGIKIAKDIDLGNQPWTPIGYGTYFNGKIDGQGYHIYNMYINKSDLTEKTHFAGLIGGTNSENCDIININLSGKIDVPASMIQKTQVGSFVGKANALGNMVNCHSDVEINIMGAPGYVGGILAFMKNANIKNCSYSGNIIIASSGKVTNGVGGILGCTNSSTTGIEAIINGCYFDGTIRNNGSGTPKYVAGINSYSNLSKAAETITNNYVVGTIDCNATDQGAVYGKTNTVNFDCENNYFCSDYTLAGKGGTPMDMEKFHSGEATYLLNGDQMEFLFGQELDSDNNMPIVYNGTNRVYKTVFMYNDSEYAVLYNNTEMKFPQSPVPDDGTTFGGWYDEKGNCYDENSATQNDLILYAKTMATGIDNQRTKDRIIISDDKIDITSESAVGHITVSDISGKEVISKTIKETVTKLDTNSLQHGIYLFKSRNGCIKFIKK
ncbi:DUF4886 domain-containing protein [Bacteroides sp.]